MKSLQLNLAKKLLIVDYGSKEKLDEAWHINSDPKMHTFHTDGSQVKVLFNGLKLTEENLKKSGIIETKPYGSPPFFCTIAYQCGTEKNGFRPGNCAPNGRQFSDSFLGAIKKEGFYWLENPVEEPTMSKYGWYASGHPEEDSGWMYEEGEEKYYAALKEFNDAESRTLKFPIIFEILE